MKELKSRSLLIYDPETGEKTEIDIFRGESAYEAAVRLGLTTLTEDEWVKEYNANRDAAIAAIETKAAEALASIPEDYTQIQEDVNQLSEEIADVNSELGEVIKTGKKSESLVWEIGAISGSTGENVDNDTRCRTELKTFDKKLKFTFPSNGGIAIFRYTEGGTFLALEGWQNESFDFEPNPSYAYRFLYDNTTTISDLQNLIESINLYEDFKAEYLIDYVDEKIAPLNTYPFYPSIINETRFWNDGTSDVSFENCKWNITFNNAASWSVLRNVLTNGHRYAINMTVENLSGNDIRLILRQSNTSYVWAASLLDFNVEANSTAEVSTVVTTDADRWIGLYAPAYTSDVSISVDTYIYDLTDVPSDVEALYPTNEIKGNPFVLSWVPAAEYAKAVGTVDKALKAYGRWYGKKIWFCGDSITDYGWYPPKVAESIGASGYFKDGHSGYSIKGCTDDIVTDPSLLDGYDILLLFAGTNDFGGSKELGTIDDDVSVDTTYGALNRFVSTIMTDQKHLRIILATPLPRGKYDTQPAYGDANAAGHTLTDYVDAIKNIGEKYHVPVIDMYNLVGWNEYNIAEKTVDGLHPTEEYTYSDIVPTLANQINIL